MDENAANLGFLDLRVFITLCESPSLTEAARRRRTSQPALSAVLKRIESVMGNRLFERDRNGLRITPAGTRFRDYCETTLRSWEALRTGETEWEHRKIKVGAHPSVACYVFPGLLAGLADAGSFDLDFRHGLSRTIQEWVLNREVDFGFVVNPIRHPDLHIRKIGDDVVTVFGVSNVRSSLLVGDPNLRQTRVILKELSRLKKGDALRELRFTPCDNLEVVRSLTLAGACYGILPSRVATLATSQRADRVLKPFLRAPKMYDEICIVARAEKLRSHESLRAVFRIARGVLGDA